MEKFWPNSFINASYEEHMSGRSSYSWGSAAQFFLARVDYKSLFLAEVDHERYFFIHDEKHPNKTT